MKKTSSFSLIELLVALSILAIVAAIIVPKYLSTRKQAGTVVMNANLKAINETFNNWMLAGGTITTSLSGNYFSFLLAGTLLKLLASPPPRAPVTISDFMINGGTSFTVADSGGYPGSSSVQMDTKMITVTYDHNSFWPPAAPSDCKNPNTFYLTSDGWLSYIDMEGKSHLAKIDSTSGTFTFGLYP